jgi:hypothetical protein
MITERTGFVVDLLPNVREMRYGLDGLTLTIEAQDGERVIVERRDGHLVTVHHAAQPDDDSALIGSVLSVEARTRATFLPDVLRLPSCPPWCQERHYDADEDHYGPGVTIEGPGVDTLASIGVEQAPGGETQALFLPSTTIRPHAMSLDQLRSLRDGLDDIIGVLEAEEAEQP